MGIRFAFVLFSLALSACEGTETYPAQRALETDYSAATAPEPVQQEPRDTFYLHGALSVRSAPSQQASLVRTVPRGEKVLLGPKDAGGWAPLYDEASDRPVGYLYRASGNVRTSAPAMPAPRTLVSGSGRARSAADRGYYTGPRGGCYTYSASGRKRYVDRSNCN
jgi:hypothetical protein